MARLWQGAAGPRKRRVTCQLCGTKFKGQPGERCPHWRRHLKSPNNPGWQSDASSVPGAADYYQCFDVRLYGEAADGTTYDRVFSKITSIHTTVRRRHLKEMLREDMEYREVRARRREWRERLIYLGGATAKQSEAYKLHVEGGLSVEAVGQALGIQKASAQARIEGAKVHEDRARRRSILSSS